MPQIELAFSTLKAFLRRHKAWALAQPVPEIPIHEAIDYINRCSFSPNYIRHCGYV